MTGRTLPVGLRRAALAAAGVLAVSGVTLAVRSQNVRPTAVASTSAGEGLLNRLRSAKGGETITLAPGDYGQVKVANRTFSPSVRIIAQGARFSSIVLTNVEGLAIDGGTVTGTGGRSIGINVRYGKSLSFQNMTVTGTHRGIAIGGSEDVLLSDIRLTGLISDGIDLPLSRRITVRRIRCSDFSPTPSSYDAAGKLTKVGDHPDCIQSWSRPKAPPVSDIVIEDCEMQGQMQGIFFGNHVRDGVDDGGFDRVRIRNNRIEVTHANGIALLDARDSEVTGNRVTTLPGAVNPRRPDSPIRTGIRVRGERNKVCGNAVAAFPRGPGTAACLRR